MFTNSVHQSPRNKQSEGTSQKVEEKREGGGGGGGGEGAYRRMSENKESKMPAGNAVNPFSRILLKGGDKTSTWS